MHFRDRVCKNNHAETEVCDSVIECGIGERAGESTVSSARVSG